MKIREIFPDRKAVIRAVLFVIAFITALTAFSFGVLGLSQNKEGYRTVDAEADGEAVTYSHGFTLNYYFTGTSGEIKDCRKQVAAVYSGALKRAYKLTDAKNTYEGYVNIASLNACKGEALNVGGELYGILKNAYEKTLKQEGYNMFAGALYEHINSILILDDPEEFDPAFNPDEADRIKKLVSVTGNLDNFELKFIDDESCTVSFKPSEEYETETDALEQEGSCLDLNLLRDAYILDIVGKALVQAGYPDGYITSESGLTYSLSGQRGLEYCIYGLKDGVPAILETLQVDHTSVFSCFKAFAFGNEKMYYKVEDNGRILYRNPYVNALDASSNDRYLSLYSVCDLEEDASVSSQEEAYPCAETVRSCLRVWSGMEEPENGMYYVLQDEPDAAVKVNER